jgi:hypothetical protein
VVLEVAELFVNVVDFGFEPVSFPKIPSAEGRPLDCMSCNRCSDEEIPCIQ